MLMLPEEATQYPRLAQFLRKDIASIPYRKPNVFRAFCRFGEMSTNVGRKVLQYGTTTNATLPILRITHMQTSEKKVDRYGVFFHTMRDIVFISTISAIAFEQVHKRMYTGAPIPGLSTEEQKYQFDPDAQISEINQFMEALVLHEIVHWGDYNNDFVHRDSVAGKKEAGHGFELAAYGKIYSNASGFRLREVLL